MRELMCNEHGTRYVSKDRVGLRGYRNSCSTRVKVCITCIHEARFIVQKLISMAKEARNERQRKRQ